MRTKEDRRLRNGVPLFKPKKGAQRPNLELVNRLRDDEGPAPVSGEERAPRSTTLSSPPAAKLLRK